MQRPEWVKSTALEHLGPRYALPLDPVCRTGREVLYSAGRPSPAPVAPLRANEEFVQSLHLDQGRGSTTYDGWSRPSFGSGLIGHG